MVSFKSIGKDLGNAGKAVVGGAKAIGGMLTGSGSDAGALGLGQYRGSRAEIDEKAFTDKTASNKRRTEFANALNYNQMGSAPTMYATQIKGGDQAQVRSNQASFMSALRDRSEGRGGPSAAELQMDRGLDQTLSGARAQAASARGMSPAAALRMSMNAGASAQQDIAGQAAILRAQEQAQAVDQYGSQMGNMRSQDLELAGKNADLTQDASKTNVASLLQTKGQKNEQERFLREGMMTMDERDRQAAMDLGKLRVGENSALSSVNSQAYQNASANRQGFMGGVANGIMGAMMMSDEKVKKNVSTVKVTGREKVDGDKKEASPFEEALKALQPGSAPPSYLAGEGLGKLGYTLYKGDEKKPKAGAGGAGGAGGLMSLASSGLGSGSGSQLLSMSDGNNKKGKGGSDPKSFLDSLSAYTYEYKNPNAPLRGEGPQYGVMAQDLEKTPIGKSMVMDTPDGKVVNYAKAGGAMLATAASLNDRMGDIEKAFMSRKKRGA